VPDILDVATRRLVPDDMNFILNSWKKSFRGSRGEWKNRQYFAEANRRIMRIMNRLPKIRIACDPLDPKHIFGWIVAEPPVLHYIYVKNVFRRAGVAQTLLATVDLSTAAKIHCTHWTSYAEKTAKKRPCFINNEV